MKLFEELYKAINDEDSFKQLFEWVPHELKIQILTHTTDLTLFLQACRKGAFNVCRLLRHEAELVGIDVLMQSDSDTQRGGCPIHYASWEGHVDIIRWLLICDHPNNTLTKSDLIGNTPILYAIYGGHFSLVKLLQTQMHPIDIKTLRNAKGHSAIIQAACGGHVEIIEWLLEQECSLTERDDMENTPLLFAAWGGHLPAVKWMLANGSSLTETSDTGHTALLSAANSGKIEVVKWLLEEMHVSPLECNTNGDTSLLLAAFGGHCELIHYLIGSSFINERNHDGLSVLLSACNGGSVEMVQLLTTEYGLSLAEHTDSYYTSIILAACGGHLELVQWLVAHGCSVMQSTVDGDTPLLLACYCGHTKVAKWLLENGSSITECNHAGLNPLISAANGGHSLTCEMLIHKGADIEARDTDGYTALLLAARRFYKEAVNILLAYGANPNIITNSRATIFDLTRDNPDLYLWLQSHINIHHVCFAIQMGWDQIAKWCLYNGSSINRKQLTEYKARLSFDNSTYRFILRILNPWTLNKYFLYGPHVREMAVLLLKVRCRLQICLQQDSEHDSTILPYLKTLPYLPVELWDTIFNLVCLRD